jgi:hypothetical protein
MWSGAFLFGLPSGGESNNHSNISSGAPVSGCFIEPEGEATDKFCPRRAAV